MDGVVTYIKRLESGDIRLVMDDVKTSTGTSGKWSKEVLFTHKDYDAQKMCGLELSKDDYAMIGENLVIRLLALNGELE